MIKGLIIIEICKNGVKSKVINNYYERVYTWQCCLNTIIDSFNEVMEDLNNFFAGFKPGDFYYGFIYRSDFEIRYRLNKEIN